ncbi:hypothetical protein LX77_02035 [Gelidibacter algens]|uniref:Uncharacterized protein n=1 Tax=Gelidibacter algens TaxID=49280 RepID=A0A1A7R3W6_9FLAO|nr:DUF6730 family protein [Gelidibacter algens]OBX26154.1 hypothetical protein A9996_06405 [Gelidibacter algens]RAJ24481.1 hypothetical protein LX77_02035 [Gelidibacter algens]
MTKLEELTALLVNEINDFKSAVEKLEKINAHLADTKIKMDLTEYKASIETHQQQMKCCIKNIESFESRFESKIKQAKIYPNWAVIVFIVSLIFGFVCVLLFLLR